MKSKILNFLLIITSLLGYLEWGGGKHLFLFQAESEVFSKLFTDPLSVLHPLIVLPIAGHILLIVTLFQKVPSKIMTYISMGCLGILLIFMFLIGLFDLNAKIALSSLPYLVVSILTIRNYRKIK